MRVAILGFGLIGGSVARALHEREPEAWSVAAWSPSGVGPAGAAAAGEIGHAARDVGGAVDGADLVVLAAPPLACLELLDDLAANHLSRLGRGAVVTDVASTKRRIVGRARHLGIRFVGGHPMAGSDESGYGASDGRLFVDRPWVICPDGAPVDEVARVERLVSAVGARSVLLDAATHDAATASISHLPLVVSAALVEAVVGGRQATWPAARQLAASGWRDMTRLARGDVEMGAGIATTNADELATAVRALRDVLDGWLADLDGADLGGGGPPETERLRRRLAGARDLLDADR